MDRHYSSTVDLSGRVGLLQTLELVAGSLQDAYRKTTAIRKLEVQEEVVTELDSLNKACRSMLKYTRQAENMAKSLT